MKTEFITALALAGAAQAAVQGFDISHYQPTVNYQAAYNAGARFVIIKVSGLSSPTYPRQRLTCS